MNSGMAQMVNDAWHKNLVTLVWSFKSMERWKERNDFTKVSSTSMWRMEQKKLSPCFTLLFQLRIQKPMLTSYEKQIAVANWWKTGTEVEHFVSVIPFFPCITGSEQSGRHPASRSNGNCGPYSQWALLLDVKTTGNSTLLSTPLFPNIALLREV